MPNKPASKPLPKKQLPVSQKAAMIFSPLFYQTHYRRSFKIIIIFLALNALLLLATFYFMKQHTVPDVYAVTLTGKLVPLQEVDPNAAPVATEPAATEPAATEPAATEPAATEPAAAEPAAAEPAATEPAATEPAATEPAAAEPAAAE